MKYENIGAAEREIKSLHAGRYWEARLALEPLHGEDGFTLCPKCACELAAACEDNEHPAISYECRDDHGDSRTRIPHTHVRRATDGELRKCK